MISHLGELARLIGPAHFHMNSPLEVATEGVLQKKVFFKISQMKTPVLKLEMPETPEGLYSE